MARELITPVAELGEKPVHLYPMTDAF